MYYDSEKKSFITPVQCFFRGGWGRFGIGRPTLDFGLGNWGGGGELISNLVTSISYQGVGEGGEEGR